MVRKTTKTTKTTKTAKSSGTSRKTGSKIKAKATKSKTTKSTTSKTTKTTKTTKPTRPRGFKVIPGASEARELIKERLEDTKERLRIYGLQVNIHTHEYENGTVDGEINIEIPRGKTAHEISWDLEHAFQTQPHGMGKRGFWFSLGTRLGMHKDEEEDRSGTQRAKGIDSVLMYYRRMSTDKMIDGFRRHRRVMIPGMEEKYRRKSESVYLRLHWNPDNEKPRR